MSWSAELKRIEAARKREERSALKRQRELERALKEQAKLSTLEQARLEVEAYENALEVLLSVHKEASPPFDWVGLVAALPACDATDEAREATERYRTLAREVLRGDVVAYETALLELSSFGELAALGSSLAFRFHGAKLVECEVTVNGREAIPAETKSLSAAGKVMAKPMPKARFHEIYQDYVCGCVLRVAREIFALLPVDEVIVTARVELVDAVTGQPAERPVLSVGMPRAALAALDFARLDPSDSMANFVRRGDVTASRKSGEFVAIEPLKPDDLTAVRSPAELTLGGLVSRVHELRAELAAARQRLPKSPTTADAI